MPLHPRSVPILTTEDAAGQPPAPLYDVGPDDTIDPDLRYRMISDLAYRRYVERGYTDGGDVDDWLDAEAEVDHLLGSRRPADTGEM